MSSVPFHILPSDVGLGKMPVKYRRKSHFLITFLFCVLY